MLTTQEQLFTDLIRNKRRFVETLLIIENKARQRVPFIYNPIQAATDREQTGRDVWLKPSQVGFSSERIANRLVDTLTMPGTNTVLIAYEDFITERLLNKVNFSYNYLESLGIPGFPVIHHNSTYEKTFQFKVGGAVESTSSIYVASARSFVAGRAETIHHLICDEFAFWPPGATERILLPALARVPMEGKATDGTVDILSTPNGENNDFHDLYKKAKEGATLTNNTLSVFAPHFFPWWMLPDYAIRLGDYRVSRYIPTTDTEEFTLTSDEVNLVVNKGLSFDQIRWRRWKILEMESLKRAGETRSLFQQEFPEDDVSCFLATGDMYFDQKTVDKMATECYPPTKSKESLNIWFEPEKGKDYIVCIDPGQAKVSQTAIGVIRFDKDELGNAIPVWCARDAGLYGAELTAKKAVAASDYYGRATIAWEANSHGLALTELLKRRRPIYMRRDIVSGKVSMEPGWLTTSKNKDYMLHQVSSHLDTMACHDLEVVRQLRNHRLIDSKVEVVGANDVLMALAIGLCCHSQKQKTGFVGESGWRW